MLDAIYDVVQIGEVERSLKIKRSLVLKVERQTVSFGCEIVKCIRVIVVKFVEVYGYRIWLCIGILPIENFHKLCHFIW